MELVILIGLQASGKTNFYRELFADSHAHVSKDLMRNARSREARQRALVTDALAGGASVVVDNTNPRREDRRELIRIARTFEARVTGYFLESTVSESLERNSRRIGRACVPPVAIHVTAKRLEVPALAEGFDALFRVRLAPDGFEITPLSGDDDVPRDSPRVGVRREKALLTP